MPLARRAFRSLAVLSNSGFSMNRVHSGALKWTRIAVAGAWLSGGCAGTTTVQQNHPLFASEEVVEKTKVYLIRPDPGFNGVMDRPVTISLGGLEMLNLAKGQYTLLSLKSGSAEMKVGAYTVSGGSLMAVSSTTQLTFFPGATQYLVLEMRSFGFQAGSEFIPRQVQRDHALRLAGDLSPVGMAVREPIALSAIGTAVREPLAVPPTTQPLVDKSMPPLHEAAKGGNTTTVAGLLSANQRSIAARDSSGGTALHVAAAYGQKDVAELLLAKGASVNDSQNDLRVTPLHLAAGNDHVEVAALLLANGADVRALNKFGQTPLMVADCQRRAAVASLLRGHVSKTDLALAQQQDQNRSSTCR